MHRLTVLLLTIFCSACATSNSNPLPTDWPRASGPTCNDISGSYVDPDAVRGEIVSYRTNGYIKSGGTLDAAWLLFGFFKVARHADPSVRSRRFLLAFDSGRALVITYFIDGAEVARKKIMPSEYKCEDGLFKFIAYSRTGDQVFNMVPNHGTSTHFAELLRAGNVLYVKFTDSTVATVYGVVPSSHTNVTWSQFPVQ